MNVFAEEILVVVFRHFRLISESFPVGIPS